MALNAQQKMEKIISHKWELEGRPPALESKFDFLSGIEVIFL